MEVVGDLVLWDCTASGCSSTSNAENADALAECEALARNVGPITSFTGTTGPLSVSRLARCNEAAPKSKS
jgi:hypothetical protein